MNAKIIMGLVGGAAITAILISNLVEKGHAPTAMAERAETSPLSQRPQVPPALSPRAIERGLNAVVLAVRPAVVSISTHWDQIEKPTRAGMQILEPFHTDSGAVGSGIIVDNAGHVLTHRQVTKDAALVRVTLFRSGQNSFLARLVAADPQTNLVLFRLPFAGELPTARLGDSSALRSGDIVIAVGSPFGLAETVTQGIVSASRRRIAVGGLGFLNLIQTDAAINQGNSGGPLVNIRGEVIGINLAIFSTDTGFSGIGFAISSNQARNFCQRAVGALL